MNEIAMKTEMDGKCVVISDERKRKIRAIIENGKVFYCGIDIASCMGYAAPSKAVERAQIEKLRLPVPWTSNRRKGVTDTWCFDRENVVKFVERMEVGDDFRQWMFGEVIPKAEAALHNQQEEELESVGVPDRLEAIPSQANLLIERLDQIITDAVLLKYELHKSM